MHRRLSAATVAVDDRLHDGLVLTQGDRGATGNAGESELLLPTLVAKVGDQIAGDGVTGRVTHSTVQNTIEPRIGRLVVEVDGLPHVADDRLELCPLLVGRLFRRESSEQPLEHRSGLDDLDRSLDGYLSHGGASVRLVNDQALGTEFDDGRSDGGPK